MPPRIAPTQSRGRGQSRGGQSSRGATPRTESSALVLPTTSSHISTIGVKRTAFGSNGISRYVLTNHFPVEIPSDIISHYDG